MHVCLTVFRVAQQNSSSTAAAAAAVQGEQRLRGHRLSKCFIFLLVESVGSLIPLLSPKPTNVRSV